jgi:CheY-like chemotaxis protein
MEAVGRLAGGVAHDFNNILSALMGYADLALGQAPPDSVLRADLEGIRSAVKSASALTAQLLAFSRRQMIRPRILNPNSLLMEMDKMLRRLIPADIELVTVLEPEIRPLRADPTQLEQVLINLVLNARDAMPQGGRITVRTTNVVLEGEPQGRWQKIPAGSYVVVSVGDDGVGMTPEVLFHLFEPFFTTKETGKGTGLGLASCYGFVRQSGGWIDVDSQPGRGTTFELFFPSLARAHPKAIEPAPGPDAQCGTETILLVEDQAQLRSVTARALRERGYRILEASNGEEALRVLSRHAEPLDVLVTDVVMPQMGGPELAEHVRRRVPGVRVLFTSGYTDPARASFDTMAPGTQFLQKPFTPGILAGKVREVRRGRAGGPGGRRRGGSRLGGPGLG